MFGTRQRHCSVCYLYVCRPPFGNSQALLSQARNVVVFPTTNVGQHPDLAGLQRKLNKELIATSPIAGPCHGDHFAPYNSEQYATAIKSAWCRPPSHYESSSSNGTIFNQHHTNNSCNPFLPTALHPLLEHNWATLWMWVHPCTLPSIRSLNLCNSIFLENQQIRSWISLYRAK